MISLEKHIKRRENNDHAKIREGIIFIIGLLIFTVYSQSILYLMRRAQLGYLYIDEGIPIESDLILRYSFLVVIGVVIIDLAFTFKKEKYGFLSGIFLPLIILLLLPFLSTLWSFDYQVTLRKSLAWFFTCVIAAWLYINRKQTSDIFLWTGLLIVALSFAFALFFPDYGISQDIHQGAWRGIFPHKNTLGAFTSLYFLWVAALLLSGRVLKIKFITILLVTFSLIYLSSSSSAMIAVFIVIIMTSVVTFSRYLQIGGKRLFWLAFISFSAFMVASALLFILAAEPVLVAREDITLSGRLDLWANGLSVLMKDSPYLGFGYQAFWLSYLPGEVPAMFPWAPHNGHSGYLDALLAFGLPGGTLLFSLLASIFLLAVRKAQGEFSFDSLFPILFLMVFIVYNATESLYMTPNNLWSVFLFYSLFLISDTDKERVKINLP